MSSEHTLNTLLELDHISKIYGDLRAVDDLTLTVPQGEWLAIVGSSGSGKTTLMNMIGCMDTPSKGSVMLEGRKLEDLNAKQLADVRKNMIGLVFQKFYLVPHLTAVENVMVAQYYHSVVNEQQALEALERVGLKERAHHLPGQLSGGEQQRVCIARALINCPKLILADEPTGNLDEKRSCSTMACSSVRSGMMRPHGRSMSRRVASRHTPVPLRKAHRMARRPSASPTRPKPRKPAVRNKLKSAEIALKSAEQSKP